MANLDAINNSKRATRIYKDLDLDFTKRDRARVGVAIEEHSTPPAPPERWPPGSMLDPLGLWWVLHRPVSYTHLTLPTNREV